MKPCIDEKECKILNQAMTRSLSYVLVLSIKLVSGFEESEIEEMLGDVEDEDEINFEEFMIMVVGKGVWANSMKSICKLLLVLFSLYFKQLF
jgi:hypothetical protein